MGNPEHYLSSIISIKSRAKLLENNLHFPHILNNMLSAPELIEKLKLAQEIYNLYDRACRMSWLLLETLNEEDKPEIENVNHNLQKDKKRLNDVVKIIRNKISKAGLSDIDMDTASLSGDQNYSEDMTDLFSLRSEVNKALKHLLFLSPELDKRTLLHIKEALKNIIDY